MTSALPAFGICGWSGSGKTTLVVELVRQFVARGLKVGVIKHDVHGLEVDREGKDSDHLFRAGADVLLLGPCEGMGRLHLLNSTSLRTAVNRLDPGYDLILSEGSKSANFARKVWLLKDVTEACPTDLPGFARVLAPNEDRVGIVTAMVEEWLQERTRSTPLHAGILFGGRSQRMGQPKHLLRIHNRTWLENTVAIAQRFVRQVVLLGSGEVPPGLRALPVLPDVPDKQGPIAGMLAAMRWCPDVSWVFLACDLPQVSSAAVDWLLRQRTPGVWAIMPRLRDNQRVEPLFACYEHRARLLLEDSFAPSGLARMPSVITPEPPLQIAAAWTNVNTPADAANLQITDPVATARA